MGTCHILQLFTPLVAPPSSPPAQRLSSANRCRFSARYGGGSDGSKWDRAIQNGQRPKFDDYNGENDVLGFSSPVKQRVWWSDDDDEYSWNSNYYNDVDDDDDDDGFRSFGVLEDSIGFDWIFKLVRAFGWMVPAIIISMLVGTEPNSIIMALALPIAQSALSFILDAFGEGPSENSSARPKSRSRTRARMRKRPITRPASKSRVREQEETPTQTSKKVSDYHSWVAANHVSGSTQSFGGWDELDKQRRMDEIPKRTPFKNANEPRKQKRSKPSKRSRKRDSPIQMLIDFFPFLGFWTKLL